MAGQTNVPRCLFNRYEALDDLVTRLSKDKYDFGTSSGPDKGIKLMCYFWNILRENPGFDLVSAVRNCVSNLGTGGDEKRRNTRDEQFIQQDWSVYMALNEDKIPSSKPRRSDSTESDTSGNNRTSSRPLSKILCNLNEATSAERKISLKLKELIEVQEKLQRQLDILEQREKTGASLLKQAEDMWMSMENAYIKKIEEIQNRTNSAYDDLREIEDSTVKWKKNKRGLEEQLTNMNKCQTEIRNAINQKKNDLMFIEKEIEDYQKRIFANLTDLKNLDENVKKLEEGHMARMQQLVYEVQEVRKSLTEEQRRKSEKENDAGLFIQDARADLHRLQKSLMKADLEHEDLLATKQELIEEMQVLGDSCKGVCEKCDGQEDDLSRELKRVDEALKIRQAQAQRCTQCVNTAEHRNFCTDCPKCFEEERCVIIDGNYCENDPRECICQAVKQRFLENVLENMEIVLSKQTKTDAGKKVADIVLACLRKSKNAKLDEPTRKVLKSFIMKSLKTNLTKATIGGAVKTRCELDPEKYERLMDCITKVEVQPIERIDAETITTKSCTRWGSVCHCVKKPKQKECICMEKAPKKQADAASCPPPDPEDDVAAGAKIVCPHYSERECGPDCGARSTEPENCGTEVKWDPEPCKHRACKSFSNIKAVQCLLGTKLLGRIATRAQMTKALLNLPPPSSFADSSDYESKQNEQKSKTVTPSQTDEKSNFILKIEEPNIPSLQSTKRTKSSKDIQTEKDTAVLIIKRNEAMSMSDSSNVSPAEDGSSVIINNRVQIELPIKEKRPTRTLSEMEIIVQNISPSVSLELAAVAVQSDLELRDSQSYYSFEKKHKPQRQRQTFEEKIQLMTDEVLSIKDSHHKYFGLPQLTSQVSLSNHENKKNDKVDSSTQ